MRLIQIIGGVWASLGIVNIVYAGNVDPATLWVVTMLVFILPGLMLVAVARHRNG